jgi:hypothetical protein
MIQPAIDVDEFLKKQASAAVKQSEDLRATVRELTLNALRNRELSLAQIKQVLRSVTAGVNAGAAKSTMNVDQVLEQAVAGMDDALLKAVQANHLALQQLVSAGQSFEQSQVKKALAELERLEDEFLKAVRQASEGATKNLRGHWANVLQQKELSGTEAGEQAAATMKAFAEGAQSAMRAQRRAGAKMAHVLGQNFATLASGILTGLSEALQQQKKQD